MPADPIPSDRPRDAALADLERLGRDRPELAGAAARLAAVLRAAFTPADTTPATLDLAAAETAWAAGRPALQALEVALPALVLRDRGLRLCEALGADDPAAAALGRAIGDGSVDLAALGWHWLRGDLIEPPAGGHDLDRLASVLRFALLPTLARLTAPWAAARPGALARWDRVDCPGCGSPPLLAEARGLEQSRFLRCGTCALEWPAARLACAACGTGDAASLRTLAVAGQEAKARVQVCDACGFRLKVLSTLGPLSPPALAVAELGLAHLDWIA